tara:strand:- start:919 stop:1074 length:156 start_codon:yes stop_codon:yes gene_type:complete
MSYQEKQQIWVDMHKTYQQFSASYKKHLIAYLEDVGDTELLHMLLNKPSVY